MRRAVLYGLAGGVLIALLKVIEYKHFVRAYPTEIYGALMALIFTGVGAWVGLKWTRRKDVVVVRESGPFVPNLERRRDLGITPREHEILELIAQGLTNRQIAGKLFVSENTVKTHSSRLFEKMNVSRRVQAVQKGRELGLIA